MGLPRAAHGNAVDYLNFSADELQRVCKTRVACECGLPAARSEFYPLLLTYCDDTQQAVASAGPTLQDVWWEIVAKYTNREITRADDKLPAISGLASRFAARFRSRYVAGLWENHTYRPGPHVDARFVEHGGICSIASNLQGGLVFVGVYK
ncbi:hypothetical protein diail_8166 [Diaporthe ilicicola]|nr:hypothetical protein diail_8166 [Diaporthe ilicicola]